MITLLEDYKRRLAIILNELDRFEHDCPHNTDYTRYKTKASCYRTFITELEREIKLESTIKTN